MFNIFDVSAGYATHPILHHVAYHCGVPTGLIGVVGPNGSGKSTFLRVLSGLLPPLKGKVSVRGEDLYKLNAPSRSDRVAYLAPERHCAWNLSVLEVLQLTPASRIEIEEVLRRCEVWHLRERGMHTLSSGERARVLIARVLAMPVPLYCLDEPIANLDPKYQMMMMEVLQEISAQGKCIVASLHELRLVQAYCDEVIMLKEGALFGHGSPDGLLTADYVKGLFSLKEKGVALFLEAPKIKGAKGSKSISAERAQIRCDKQQRG